MLRDFATGAGLYLKGIRFWRSHTRLMALGLVPAAISFVLLVAALITFGVNLPMLVDWATPFADSWAAGWRDVVRVAIGIVAFGAAAVLAVVTFTALTLTIGDPFYEKISLGVEADLGGEAPESAGGFWRSIVDGLQLVGLGILTSLVMFLLGLIPVVGSACAAVLGFVLTGRLLARELAGRVFEAHGVPLPARRDLMRTHRWRLIGFGVLTQLFFLIPLGPVLTMPSAVAGATLLARGLMADAQSSEASAPTA